MMLALVGLIAAGCSDDDTASDENTAEPAVTTTATSPPQPPGPAADVSVELSGGNGVFVGAPTSIEPVLDAAGYEQHEYAAEGEATSYTAEEPLPADGRWTFQPGDTAPYRTRVVVRRPAQADTFSGTVVVEWLNVSGGVDADPAWQSVHEELTRAGHIWVGVTAQSMGVNGGEVPVTTPASEAGGAGRGLRALDPARYESLEHPGDGYSFDLYTQVARAVRAGGPFLGNVTPDVLLAAGQSQSAFALVTYVNGVQPLTDAFDGFFVHSRASSFLPLVGPGENADIVSAIAGTPARLRTDTEVPILDLQTETDVTSFFNSAAVRQDDTELFRLWEVAGTAHADLRLVGAMADSLGCGAINDGPRHLVAKAVLRALDEWVRTGSPPPNAPRLELTADPAPTQARDADGIAVGGIRTPLVDVPVDVLSGAPGSLESIICVLSGSTTPLPPEALAARYPSRDDYEDRFGASVDDVIAEGFVLAEDREALAAYADPARIPA